MMRADRALAMLSLPRYLEKQGSIWEVLALKIPITSGISSTNHACRKLLGLRLEQQAQTCVICEARMLSLEIAGDRNRESA